MNRPERIEDNERPDSLVEQRDPELKPSLLQDRRGSVEVPPGAPAVRNSEANRDTIPLAEEARPAREAPTKQVERPSGESVWDNESEVRGYRERWSSIQTAFVDEPRQAVREADPLVQSVVKSLADRFAHQREELYTQWDRGDNVSTEDLRIAVQHYRTFFDRLLQL